ncbi:class I SAM-dependent methyltransferase [Coleofasciculus sp.]|uniref:class I SAM-dependent methyltransferase n=1 Tax=Coleofasciculus sp. TaxID=3100458 RepID=UPI0039FA2A0F
MRAMADVQILDITPWSDENSQILANYIRENFSGKIQILEAGCGQEWGLNLQGVDYELTGVDLSEEALDIRKNQKKDLDKTIVGDLRTVELDENHYDVIYSSYVLEHVDGAEQVLDKIFQWLKPKGVLMLRIPDADTVYGFASKYLPFWVHVWYKKYIQGYPHAGEPGYAPFPVFYDAVVSRRGMQAYCRKQGLPIKIEYSYAERNPGVMFGKFAPIGNIIFHGIGLLSLGRIATNRGDVVFVIEKP